MTPDIALVHAAIRDLLTRYTYNGDSARFAQMVACFAADGVLEFPGGAQAAGLEAIVAALTSGEPNPTINFVRHHISNPLIDVADDGLTAKARSYFTVTSNNGPDHSGVYDDRLILTDVGWRFAYRRVRVDWYADTTLWPQARPG